MRDVEAEWDASRKTEEKLTREELKGDNISLLALPRASGGLRSWFGVGCGISNPASGAGLRSLDRKQGLRRDDALAAPEAACLLACPIRPFCFFPGCDEMRHSLHHESPLAGGIGLIDDPFPETGIRPCTRIRQHSAFVHLGICRASIWPRDMPALVESVRSWAYTLQPLMGG